MAGVITNVDSDVQKLRKLKNEIEEVKKALKGINIKVDVDIAKGMEAQLKSLTDQYNALVTKVAEAEGKILLSTQRINDASEKIIKAQEKLSKVTGVTTPINQNAPSNNASETASIQLQAKAYDELRDGIDCVIGTRSQNIKRMIEESNTIRLINAEIKKITKSQGESSTLSSAQQRRLEQLNNSLLTHKTALSEVRQNLNNNVKMDNAAATSMNGLSQSLSRMRMTYRELTEEERKSPFGKELLASINQADAKIKELDATIGNHQRNVGNYGKQWNGLSMSIQQVGRELPSLAYGPKVFFSAISNNLPILADEIKRARIEYDLLKKSGQSATPVWKQIISSLFSWQTALTVGITLLTLYGDKVVDWVTSLVKAKNTIKEMLSAENEMALARKNAVSNSIKERMELDLLYKKLKDTTLSTKERNAAVNEWMKKHPQHSNIMNGELVSLGKLESAYQLLSKQIVETAKARAYSEKITELTKEREEAETRRLNSLNTLERSKAASAKNGSDLQKTITKNAQKQYDAIAKEVEQYDKKIAQIQKKIKVDDLFPQPQEGTYDYWQQQVQIADTSLKQIKEVYLKVLKSGNKEKIKLIPNDVKNQYDKAIALKARAEKALSAYDTSSKQESEAEKQKKAQEKYKLLLDKQSREQARLKIDSLHGLEQIEINGLEEGSEKVLRQRKLNHEKELEQIKREAEDKKLKEIEKAQTAFEANPENKGKAFDVDKFVKSEPAKKQFAVFDKVAETKTKNADTKYNRGDDLKGLLNEYQDYTDKRLAIERKFNEDIAVLQEQRKQAVKSGDTPQVEQIDRSIAQATRNKGMGLMSLDYDKLKESPEYVRAFENLKETSSETLNSLLSQLENAKQTAAKVLSPDQLREYTTTIQEIMDELDSRNPFQALSDKKQELADAEEELANAQIELENARAQAEAVKGGAKIENGVKSSKFNEKTGKIDSTKAYLTEAQALDKVKDKTAAYNSAKDKVVKKSAKVKKAEKDVTKQIDELSKAVSDVGAAIGGPAGEIISLIGDIGSFTMMAMDGVKAAADTSANAISTVEKASVILAIISAAVQIATKIFDMFGKDTTTENYEKAKEAYESYINILDRVIEKQLELAESLSGENANAAYQKALDAIKEQSSNARVLGKQYLDSGASRKSHSKGYDEVRDMSWEGWNQAANALGMSVDNFKNKMGGRMTGLFELTDEQLVKLQEDAGIFWSQLDSDTQNYADQIVNGVAKIAEVMEQSMTDTTLIDVVTLRSDFLDLLTDMDADSASFAGNFEEYMRNAILNSMLKQDYMERLKKWREKFYAAMDGGVTEEEYNALKDEGQQIADEMKNRRDEMADMFGWTGESSSQSSTQKGFQAMSQETGEELNGRFTALQIAGEEIKNQSIIQTGLLSSINEKMTLLDLSNEDIPQLAASSSNIAGRTREIITNSYQPQVNVVFPDAKLDVLTVEVSTMKNIVNEMRTLQVEGNLDTQEIREGIQIISKNSPRVLANMDEMKRDIKNVL